METITNTTEKKQGFISTCFTEKGAGVFAFLYVLAALTFILSIALGG